MDTVQIRNVDTASIRKRILFVMLVDVQSEQDYVNSVKVLENDNALASKVEFIGIVFESVSFLHSFADLQLLVDGRHLPDRNFTALIYQLSCFLDRNTLNENGGRTIKCQLSRQAARRSYTNQYVLTFALVFAWASFSNRSTIFSRT